MAHSSVFALIGIQEFRSFSAGLGSPLPIAAMKAKPSTRIPMAQSSVFTLLGQRTFDHDESQAQSRIPNGP